MSREDLYLALTAALPNDAARDELRRAITSDASAAAVFAVGARIADRQAALATVAAVSLVQMAKLDAACVDLRLQWLTSEGNRRTLKCPACGPGQLFMFIPNVGVEQGILRCDHCDFSSAYGTAK